MLFRLAPFIALLLLTGCVAPPHRTSVTVGVSSPNARVSVHVPAYPDMAPVPGYPVYYAPYLGYNYFFYDGLYWIYYGDYWYSSTWYNGPWESVHPYDVPAFILRVPVRYYRVPPRHFHGWHPDAPPHWGERWGREWNQRRSGWDQWDRRAEPRPAPLPHYQRDYSGRRYPPVEQQRQLNREHYRYQPFEDRGRDRENEQERREPRAPRTGVPPGIGAHPASPPMQIGRDTPPPEAVREMPRGEPPMQLGREAPTREVMRGESNSGRMPPQMRRDEAQRPDYPAPVTQEPPRRTPPGEPQMREQPAAPVLAPGRGPEREKRREENHEYERGDSRMDSREGDRRGDRERDRRSNGERYR